MGRALITCFTEEKSKEQSLSQKRGTSPLGLPVSSLTLSALNGFPTLFPPGHSMAGEKTAAHPRLTDSNRPPAHKTNAAGVASVTPPSRKNEFTTFPAVSELPGQAASPLRAGGTNSGKNGGV